MRLRCFQNSSRVPLSQGWFQPLRTQAHAGRPPSGPGVALWGPDARATVELCAAGSYHARFNADGALRIVTTAEIMAVLPVPTQLPAGLGVLVPSSGDYSCTNQRWKTHMSNFAV